MTLSVTTSAVRQLFAVAQGTPEKFPAYFRRDALAQVPPQGLGFFCKPSARKTPDWFSFAGENIAPRILVFWPVFLRNAGTPGPLQLPAWQILTQLLPIIDNFDTVLVHLAKTLTLEQIQIRPDSAEVLMFRNHLREVTANRLFRRSLRHVFNAPLRPLRDKKLEDELRTCPSGTHYSTPESRCDSCRGFEWTLYGVNYLRPDGLKDLGKVPLELVIPDKVDGILPHTGYGDWDKELRWMMSCLTPEEGAVRTNDNKLLVNFSKLSEQAAELRRDSPMRRIIVSAADNWNRGLASYDLAMKHLSGVVAERTVPLMDLAAAQGWEVRDVLRAPIELFDLPKIWGRFERNRRLSPYRRKRPNPPQGRRHVVALDYVDPDGNSHIIRCFRRNIRNRVTKYYSVPWLDGVPPVKKAYFYRMAGEVFWCLHGVVNQPKPDSDRKVLEHFERWLSTRDMEISEHEFRRLLYDQRLPERLQKVASGKQAHLATFSRREDGALAEIASLRPPGRFTEEQKRALVSALPGRQWLGIKRRFEQLAFQFALAKGWTAYLASGWKTNNFRKREYRWKQRGVRA